MMSVLTSKPLELLHDVNVQPLILKQNDKDTLEQLKNVAYTAYEQKNQNQKF